MREAASAHNVKDRETVGSAGEGTHQSSGPRTHDDHAARREERVSRLRKVKAKGDTHSYSFKGTRVAGDMLEVVVNGRRAREVNRLSFKRVPELPPPSRSPAEG